MFSLGGKRVWVAGHQGMVGSALVRRLQREECDVITSPRDRLDLRRQAAVEQFLAETKPDAVFVAAAKVGGILANTSQPAEFLYDNLLIEANIIRAAHDVGVKKLLLLGSSCIYPRAAEQPISESALLSGPLEPTNQWYAIAKIAGVKLCEAHRLQYGDDFIAAMPSNLYGPGDTFDPDRSHVLPALIHKAHLAKTRGEATLTIWGSGLPRREFLHVDDCADAMVLLMMQYSDGVPINVGSGSDISILELAEMVCRAVGFGGRVVHDRSKPDGTPRKLMQSERLRALGWKPAIALEEGIAATYRWYLETATAAVPA